MGDGVVGLHLTGKEMLAAIRLGEGGDTQIQRDLDGLPIRGAGEAQQGAHHLPHAAVVVVHIGQRLIEVVVLGQGGVLMEHRRLIVDKALEVDLQRLRNVVERLDVDGDGAVFILRQRGLALVDHGGELLDGIASALSIFLIRCPTK